MNIKDIHQFISIHVELVVFGKAGYGKLDIFIGGKFIQF